MTNISDAVKIETMDRLLEMSQGGHCHVWKNEYARPDEVIFIVTVKLTTPDGDLVEFKTSGNLIAAVAEAYRRFRHYTRALPEFNASRTIEHLSSKEEIKGAVGREFGADPDAPPF